MNVSPKCRVHNQHFALHHHQMDNAVWGLQRGLFLRIADPGWDRGQAVGTFTAVEHTFPKVSQKNISKSLTARVMWDPRPSSPKLLANRAGQSGCLQKVI